jgi:uncharacterized membrane protein
MRIESIDLLRGLVMVIMALDHVRMYFGPGTWYAEPTNLATTTPLLFFTRWITHFCAPVFVFLAGTSAFLYGSRRGTIKETAWFLLTRGVWLVFVELAIVNFAWTFDVSHSFRLLQVIWAMGIGMIVLAGLVFLPTGAILVAGMILVFGHNLLDTVTVAGSSLSDFLWYTLHQPNTVSIDGTLVSFVYPVLPWIGLMALGYTFGTFYRKDIPGERRRQWLLAMGVGATLLFLLLRGLNLYGEPREWRLQDSALFSLMSFLNTTKYPPSLHFLLMTMGPALISLAAIETLGNRLPGPLIVFGRVPFFFYIVHLYLVHALALLLPVFQGGEWTDYILSAGAIRSGRLSGFGLSLEAVYVIWVVVILLLYPLCRWYRTMRKDNPARWWLSYL